VRPNPTTTNEVELGSRKTPSQKKLSTTTKAAKAAEVLDRIRGLEGEIARVLQDTQEKVRQLEYLTEFSALLNSTLDTSVIREKALQATCKLLACETASLLLVDRKTGELYWETALGRVGEELKRTVRLPINGQSIAGYVAKTGESLIINDVGNDPRHYKKAGQSSSFVSRTMLCVPLRAKGKTIGVLQALNKLSSVPAKPSKHSWPDFQPEDLKLVQTLSHQVAIAVENSRLYTDLRQSFYDTVESLAEEMEKKDRYTGGHTKRVVHFSMCIAKYMKLNSEQVEQIRLGALLHDIGKIGVHDAILKKQAPLNDEEWEVMKEHPELGYDILSRVEGLKDVVGGMRFHHERWDGQGYPMGLKELEIPLIARVISVADTYDAMVSTRPYRKGLPAKTAFDEIVKHRGTQFDPAVVDAFIQAFQHEKMGQGAGRSSPETEPKLP
jgi:putative nucleotidyltransferase with HDIG domain